MPIVLCLRERRDLNDYFRVQGKSAELWHPDTGKIEPASYKLSDGRTTVPLHLEPWGTVFVVFRHDTKATSRSAPTIVEQPITTLDGPWDLAFQPERGAPPPFKLESLISWHESKDEGVKYFSGTATYTKSIQAPADWFKSGAHLWIDLGSVKNLAEVSVNGKPLGVAWKMPYRVDATGALKPGANSLEIKVTNGWVNRIIGDRQPNVTKTYTFTSPKFYKADAPLQPSGLLGPVRILRTTKKKRSITREHSLSSTTCPSVKRRPLLQALPVATFFPASLWAASQQDNANPKQASTVVYELGSITRPSREEAAASWKFLST